MSNDNSAVTQILNDMINTAEMARAVNLRSFLLSTFPDDWILRHDGALQSNEKTTGHATCIIEKDYWYWNGTSTGSHSPINLLTDFYGYSVGDAIRILCDFARTGHCAVTPASTSVTPIVIPPAPEIVTTGSGDIDLPEHAANNKHIFNFLTETRMISKEIIRDGLKNKCIYQDVRGNCIFLNPESGWYELRAANDSHIHGVGKGDGYWQYGGGTVQAIICEAAIDALSLYDLLKPIDRINRSFISIGGIGKHTAFAQVYKNFKGNVMIAVDNDNAGDIGYAYYCYKYGRLPRLVPTDGCKDWNELLQLKKSEMGGAAHV